MKASAGKMEVAAYRDIGALEPEWEDLADRVGAAPFVRPGWIGAWWRAFGRGELELVTQRRAGHLVGVLPLRRILGSRTSPTNWHTPVFGPIAEDAAALAELLEGLLARGHAHIALSFVDSEDPVLPLFREIAAGAGYQVADRLQALAPYLTLGEGVSDPGRLLSAKRLSSLRRRRRLLEKEGRLELDVAHGDERFDELLDEGLRIEGLAWKGSRGTAIVSRPRTRRFYTEIASWAAEHGWLRLCFLRLDGRPLAFDLALEQGESHYLLKTGFDPEYRWGGPGILLRQDAIARATALGLRRYEFLGLPEPTKLEWTQSCHERLLIEGFRQSPLGTLRRHAFTNGRRVASNVFGLDKARKAWDEMPTLAREGD